MAPNKTNKVSKAVFDAIEDSVRIFKEQRSGLPSKIVLNPTAYHSIPADCNSFNGIPIFSELDSGLKWDFDILQVNISWRGDE